MIFYGSISTDYGTNTVAPSIFVHIETSWLYFDIDSYEYAFSSFSKSHKMRYLKNSRKSSSGVSYRYINPFLVQDFLSTWALSLDYSFVEQLRI